MCVWIALHNWLDYYEELIIVNYYYSFPLCFVIIPMSHSPKSMYWVRPLLFKIVGVVLYVLWLNFMLVYFSPETQQYN